MKVREAFIHPDLNTVRHRLGPGTGPHIGMGQLMNAPEGQERPQLENYRLIRVNDGVPYQQLLLVMDQDALLLHDYIAHPVGHPGNILNIKVLHIFVSLRAVVVTVILMDTCVEALTVTDYCGVDR